MKRYIIPIILQIACGSDVDSQEKVINNIPAASDRQQVLTVPTDDIPKLEPLFNSYGPEVVDSSYQVRRLSRVEQEKRNEIVDRAFFLAPYAEELAATGALYNMYGEYGISQGNGTFYNLAQKAVDSQESIFIEPANVVGGKYHIKTIVVSRRLETGESIVVSRTPYCAYTFPQDYNQWDAAAFMHETAHDVFPIKHHSFSEPIDLAQLGKHVRDEQDLVYNSSEVLAMLEAPITGAQVLIQNGRTGKISPETALSDLDNLQGLTDEQWSGTWSDAVQKAFKDYINEAGLSSDLLQEIYYRPEFQQGCRRIVDELVKEYEAETKISDHELAELRARYNLSPTSGQIPEIEMYVYLTYTIPGEDKEVSAERAETEKRRVEELIERKNKEIDRVNIAVRRTREWK